MPFNPDLCAGCPLEGQHKPVEPEGYEDAPYVVVTDVPSKAAAKQGRLLPPAQRKLFDKHMENEGFDPDDFQYVPMCLCPYDQDSIPNKEKTKIHKHCRRHFEDFIEEVQPIAIIPLGAAAAVQAFGRAVKITKVRGLAHRSTEFGVPIFPMLSPAVAVRYVQNEPLFAADAASFGRLADADMDIEQADEFTTGEYTLVDDLQFLIDMDPDLISFDTETTGLRWYQRGVDVRSYDPALHEGKPYFKPRFQILTMQFTVEKGKAYVLPWDHPQNPIPEERKPALRNQLRKLLCDPKRIVIGQRLKFDCVALWKTEGIRFRIGGDTGMLAAIYDENMPEKNLDVLTKYFAKEMAGYADRFNATVNKERMWETPLEKLIPYGGGDTDAAFRVYLALEELVAEDEKNWNHYVNVSIPGLNAFAAMETRGSYIDTGTALQEFEEYMTQEVENQRKSLLAQVPRSIKRQHAADPRFKGDVEKALSFSRQDFLKDILFNHPDGFRLKPVVFTKTTQKLPDHLREPSTSSKDHLPFFFDSCPFTFELAEYVKNERLLSTNVIGFKEKYVVGGMVRPTYHLDVAVTRRSASRDPNGQNCFGPDTEVLTTTGWRRFGDIPHGEPVRVAQYDISTGEIDFVRPLDHIVAPYSGDMLSISSDIFIDLQCTPNHRFYLRNRKNKTWRVHTADSFCGDKELPVAGYYKAGTVSWRDSQIALICALQADGHKTACGAIDWAFSKKRKADRLRWALASEGVPHSLTWSPDSDRGRCFRIYVGCNDVPAWLRDKKVFGSWLLDADETALQSIATELMLWDGDSTRGHTYVSKNPVNTDWVQVVYTLTGSRSWKRHLTGTNCEVVNVTQGRPYSLTSNYRTEREHYEGSIHCFTMPKDTLVVRHNGRVAIVGNSPKRGKKAKMYQRCYIAPKGKVIISCVAEGERVETQRGAIPIEQVEAGDLVLGMDGRYCKVSLAAKTGVNRDVVKIATASGRSVRVTPDHRMTVLRGAKIEDIRADELQDTDYLLTDDLGISSEGTSTLTEEDSYWLGQFLGDGYASRYDATTYRGEMPYHSKDYQTRFALGLDLEAMLPELTAYTRRRFSANVSVCGNKGDTSISGKRVYDHFFGLTGKNGPHTIRVPEEVWRSDSATRRAFLAGMLDSDGSIHSRRATITSVSEGMIDDLLELGASIGVFGVKRVVRIKGGYKTNTEFAYNMDVFGASSLARLESRLPRKAERLKELVESKHFTQCRTEFVPMELVESMNYSGAQKAVGANRLFSNARRNGRGTRDAVRVAMEAERGLRGVGRKALQYRYDRVVAVTADGQSDVYDLTVPDGSHFTTRGFKNHNCDLSQAELRIAGDMAKDPEIIRIYNQNGDIHVSTACIVLGITEAQFHELTPEEKKDARTKAKAVNFGFIYGMSWRKFIIYAKTQYGVEFTEKQAKRIRSEYFKKYKGLARWHEVVRDFVRQHGFVRSYSGLVRHLPQVWSEEEYIQAEAERQAVNSPVQEFGSTLGVMAMGRIDEEVDPQYLEIIGFIHDAIYAYVDEQYVDWGMKALKWYLENNPLEETFGRKMRIPIKADASFGWNQGEMHELEDFSLSEPYDFSKVKDKDGKSIKLARQKTPPNNGRLSRSPYTDPDLDLEDESVVRAHRIRKVRAGSSVVESSASRRKRIAETRAAAKEAKTARRIPRTRT